LELYVDFYGTGKVAEARLEKALDEVMRASRPQPPDLCAHQRLWPFRPPAGAGRRLLLGTHRPRRRIALKGSMTAIRYDVLGLGNAVVDVITRADDAFLVEHHMRKGGMALIDEPPDR
jgi:hypothetical protein